MGLGNSSRATYINIVDGKLARRYKVEIAGKTKSRTTSTGKLVHEEFFDHVSGFIQDVQKIPNKDPKFGDQLIIIMVDGEERYILQTHVDGGYGRAFMKLLPNVDFSKRTTIIPSMKIEDGGHKKVTMFIQQQGVATALKHYFTFNDPKGMPPATSREWKGKTEYDYTAQINFLFEYFEKNLRPKLVGAAAALPSTPQSTPADGTVKKETFITDIEYEADDLPF